MSLLALRHILLTLPIELASQLVLQVLVSLYMTTLIGSVLVFALKGPMLRGISLVLEVRRNLYRLSNKYLGILAKQYLYYNLPTRNLLCQCNHTTLCYCMPCKLLRISYKSAMLYRRNMPHHPSSILFR